MLVLSLPVFLSMDGFGVFSDHFNYLNMIFLRYRVQLRNTWSIFNTKKRKYKYV